MSASTSANAGGMALSVVVPCYNEQGNIPLIVDRFQQVFAGQQGVEVLLVNNGSTDNSAAIFEQELAKARPGLFRVVNVVKNQGYGFGILSGLEAATGHVLAWTHADMQTDPNDVVLAWQIWLKEQDPRLVVKGERKQRRLAEAFFTWGMGVISSFALGTRLDDINAQPKLFSRGFYEQQIKGKAPHDFSLDLYLLYCAIKHGRVKTLPVYFGKRLHGEAKGGGSWKTRKKLIKRTWAYIFELRSQLKNQTR